MDANVAAHRLRSEVLAGISNPDAAFAWLSLHFGWHLLFEAEPQDTMFLIVDGTLAQVDSIMLQ